MEVLCRLDAVIVVIVFHFGSDFSESAGELDEICFLGLRWYRRVSFQQGDFDLVLSTWDLLNYYYDVRRNRLCPAR